MVGIGFSGSGYNAMYKDGADGYLFTGMTFADNGNTLNGWVINWPPGSPLFGDGHLWHHLMSIPGISDKHDPACFTGGTTAHVATLVCVTTPHAISTLRVRGEDSGAAHMYMSGTTQNVPAGNSFQIVESDMSTSFITMVWNGAWSFEWYYDVDDRPTPNVQFYPGGGYKLFLTIDTPGGSSVTVKRVDWCTQLANGQDTLAKIGDAVGPDATGGERFGSKSIFGPSPTLTTAWEVMDGNKADCGTLSTLMKYELDMLGATGSEVRFVFARHASWVGLSQPSPPDGTYLETDGSGHELGIWFSSGLGRGWNNYEGCCLFQSKWWEGGLGSSQTSAYNVLRHVADPNTSGSSNSHQCWDHDLPTAVSYPAGTP